MRGCTRMRFSLPVLRASSAGHDVQTVRIGKEIKQSEEEVLAFAVSENRAPC